MNQSHSIELSGLVKTYGSTRALDDVDLRIPTGSFTAILGPSGSGKTTCSMPSAASPTWIEGRGAG